LKLKRKAFNPEIPTASMADIAFLLIVFFMLTTVFSTNKGVEHLLPPNEVDTPDTIDPEESIYVQIFPSGQFQIDRKPYTIDEADKVYAYVWEKVQQNAQKPIIVHTNREAKYGDMMAVLAQIKKVGKDMKTSLAITIPTPQERQRYDQYGVQ